MNISREALFERFSKLVEGMYLKMHPALPEEWPKVELTMPQVKALFLLHQGPQRMGDIATYLGCSLPSATSMMDRLVNKGLVERLHDPQDRRVVTCRLTPQGKEEVERFWSIKRKRLEEVAGLFTLGELKRLVEALEPMARAIERQGEGGRAGANPPGQDPERGFG